MDLLIAIMQRSAVLDVGGQAAHRWRRQTPDRERSAPQVIEEGAVGSTKRAPEGSRDGGEVRLLGNLDTRLPSLEAIDIRRFNGTTRMAATWFTAVFNVDPEDDPFRLRGPAAFDVIRRGNPTDSREDDGIGWRRTWLRSADLMIIRIAQAIDDDWRDKHPSLRVTAAQAGAVERVILAFRRLRMEVHVDDVAWVGRAFIVARMLPLAADARIAEDFTAIHVTERCTELATVRDLINGQPVRRSEWEDRRVHCDAGLVNKARDERSTTRYAAGHRRFASDGSRASARSGLDRMTTDIVDARHRCRGNRRPNHRDWVSGARAGYRDATFENIRNSR